MWILRSIHYYKMIIAGEGERKVSKRDYKSYRILDEELMQEPSIEDSKNLEEGNIHIEDREGYYGNTEESVHNEGINTENSMTLEKEALPSEGEPARGILVKPEIIKSLDEEELIRRVNLYKSENKQQDEPLNSQEYKADKQNTAKEESQSQEEENDNSKVDMSFSGYKSYQQKRERSRFTKWMIRLMKVILTIMLLPFISIIGIGIMTFLGGFIAAIIGSVTIGFAALGSVCFMSSQIDAILIALGVSASITAFSFAGILFILFWMLMKWIISLFRGNKRAHKKVKVKEER